MNIYNNNNNVEYDMICGSNFKFLMISKQIYNLNKIEY